MAETPDKQSLIDNLISAREAHAARAAEIESGAAEPWLYEAQRIALETAGETNPEDAARDFVVFNLVQAKPDGEPDPRAIGEDIGKRLRKVQEYRREGPLGGLLNRNRFLFTGTPLDSIEADLAPVRGQQLPQVPKIDASPVREWPAAPANQGPRQPSPLQPIFPPLPRQH